MHISCTTSACTATTSKHADSFNPAAMDTNDTRTILVVDDDDHPGIVKRMATTTARLEADFSRVETKIHRFPRSLRGIGGDKLHNDRYIVPSVVAIGPYHHGSPHLRKMEDVKLAAAYYLCHRASASGGSTAADQVYEKVRAVAGAARACYDADDPAVVSLGDAEFADMMFLDGCFLLQYMVAGGDDDTTAPLLQNRMTLSTGTSIQKDIFLLENQIPWLVLEVLMEFIPVKVRRFVVGMGEKFLPGVPGKGKKPKHGLCCRRGMHCGCIPTALPKTTTRAPSDEESRGGVGSTEQHKPPPHLLGLLRSIQVGCMPEDERKYTGFSSSWSSSAVELAEMGVVLTPSTEPWFGDMRLRKGPLCGELSLSPVFLSDVTACWLVNMAALEASTAVVARGTDGFLVSSYLSVLAMLMDRKEDVHELRRRGLVHGPLSNKQALGFFKGLGQHLRCGRRYFAVLERIDAYKRHRPVRIKAYKFVYKYNTIIAAFLSVTGVLIGIFKTLLSLKHHCPYAA